MCQLCVATLLRAVAACMAWQAICSRMRRKPPTQRSKSCPALEEEGGEEGEEEGEWRWEEGDE